MRAAASLLVAAFLLAVPAQAGDMPDLAKAAQPPKKEPTYASKSPLYGLLLFGPKADKPVWFVLDSDKPGGAGHDVLHIDLDADGDLTGKGERLGAKDHSFTLAELTDPCTGVKHTNFSLRHSAEQQTVMVALKWRDKFKLGGGYPSDPEKGYMKLATKPADAPIVWMHGDGPIRFQRWYGGKLTIGEADDFKVFLGQPGRGPSTFCAAQEHILPAGEGAQATLLYKDGMGKEQRLVCELKEKC